MTEEEFLKFLRQKFRPHSREVICGVGDDCAVLDFPDHWLLLTLDTFVEGRHFCWDYFTPHEVGRRLAAANLSDIAAMGGKPTFALLSLSTPRLKEERITDFLEGIKGKLALYGAELIGGDTCRHEKWVISLTLLGHTPKGGAVFRHGAKPGDLIFVSRPLGASAAALYLWQKGLEPPASLKKAHLDPDPEVALGATLAENQLASAMIDVSDGLLLDLERLCEASGVGAELELERIPVAEEVKALPLEDPYSLALKGGEDFALLFTVPAEKTRVLTQLCRRKLYPIGRIIPSPGLYVLEDQKRKPVAPEGFDHFKV